MFAKAMCKSTIIYPKVPWKPTFWSFVLIHPESSTVLGSNLWLSNIQVISNIITTCQFSKLIICKPSSAAVLERLSYLTCARSASAQLNMAEGARQTFNTCKYPHYSEFISAKDANHLTVVHYMLCASSKNVFNPGKHIIWFIDVCSGVTVTWHLLGKKPPRARALLQWFLLNSRK